MNTLLEVCVANAIVASALAVVAAIVGRIARRPALTHALWIIVLLKLISPPLFRIPISWHWPERLIVSREPAPTTNDLIDRAVRAESTDTVVLIEAPMDVLPDETATEPAPALVEPAAVVLPWQIPTARSVILAGWVAGSCIWFCVAVSRLLRFHRILQLGTAAGPAIQVRCRQIVESADMVRCPIVWLVPGRVSPLLWTLGSPAKLVLPQELSSSLDREQLDTLMAHELAHARRRDHWVRWLEFAVLGVYWWNPVAWWARWEIRQAEEACCDAWVVSTRPGAARAYAEALVETVGFLSRTCRPVPPLASGVGHVQFLKRRLTMILRPEPRHRASWTAYAAALLLALVVLPFAPYQRATMADDSSPPAAAVTPPADPAGQADSRELEQRLKTLESKLEKIITALESAEKAASDPNVTSGKTPQAIRNQAKDQAKVSKAIAAEAQVAAQKAAEQAKAQGAQAAQIARQAAADAAAKARLADEAARNAAIAGAKAQTDAQGAAELGRQLGIAIQRSFDPERMADLGRVIGEAVSKNIDPEQMAELGRQIEESVKKSIDTKDFEMLGKQIEEAVNKSFDPKRMKELEVQIEQAVNRAFDPEQAEALERSIEETVQKYIEQMKDLELPKEKVNQKRGASEIPAPKEKPATKPSKTKSPAADRKEPDVEQRLRTLEEKMDRILNRLRAEG